MDKVKVEEKRKRSAFSRPSLPLPQLLWRPVRLFAAQKRLLQSLFARPPLSRKRFHGNLVSGPFKPLPQVKLDL